MFNGAPTATVRLTPDREAPWVRHVDLPEDKGAYVLIVWVARTKRLGIGRLGTFDLVPGYYAYVGSACGPGGIRARVGHHLESVAAPHWHIDYLLRVAAPAEVWFAIADRKLEQDWAEFLAAAPGFRTPIARFGASDYRWSRTSHLFYARRRPSFRWFQEQMQARFEAGVRPQQLVLVPPGASPSVPSANTTTGNGSRCKTTGQLGTCSIP